MTPIFKRSLKRCILTTAFMAIIVLVNVLSITSGINTNIHGIVNAVNANDISPESFKTKAEAEKTAEILQNAEDRMGRSYIYSTDTNSFDVEVPSVLLGMVNAKTRATDYAAGMGFALAAGCAAYAFADERGRKKQSFVNALPYKRTRLFWERALSGIVALCLFFAANYIILALYIRNYMPSIRFLGERLAMGNEYMQRAEELKFIGMDMVLNALEAMLFYAIMLFAQTVFANTVYACMIAGGALFFGMGAIDGAADICGIYNIPFTESLKNIFIRVSNLLNSDRPVLIPIFLIFTAIFIIMAYIADKNVRLERIGELFMFKPFKYIVIVLFTAEGAFSFFHFIYWGCNIRVETLLSIVFVLLAGAAVTLLLFNKLILRGER